MQFRQRVQNLIGLEKIPPILLLIGIAGALLQYAWPRSGVLQSNKPHPARQQEAVPNLTAHLALQGTLAREKEPKLRKCKIHFPQIPYDLSLSRSDVKVLWPQSDHFQIEADLFVPTLPNFLEINGERVSLNADGDKLTAILPPLDAEQKKKILVGRAGNQAAVSWESISYRSALIAPRQTVDLTAAEYGLRERQIANLGKKAEQIERQKR